MKKFLKYLYLFLALAILLTGCKQTKNSEKSVEESSRTESVSDTETTKSGEYTIIDQADREVTIKEPVEKIAVMQHHSLDIIAQLGGQDKVIATEKNWERDLGPYIKDVFPGIEELATPGDLKEWNVEALAELKPDLVIAASQANPESIQKLEDLGIPVVVVSLRGEGKQEEAQNPRLSNADKAYTDGLEWAIKTIGKFVDQEEKAEDLWNYCLESRQIVEDGVGDVADEQRVRVFIANENDQTYGNDKYVGAQMLRAGAINVAAKDIQGYKPYSFEQLANWDPDVIIIQDRYPEVYDKFTSDSKYKELRAVKEGKVILAPYWTKPWGNPDSDSLALGELYFAHKFYPEKIDKKLVEDRAKEFYEKFYGVEFTGEI